jgi:hypothetical protein
MKDYGYSFCSRGHFPGCSHICQSKGLWMMSFKDYHFIRIMPEIAPLKKAISQQV